MAIIELAGITKSFDVPARRRDTVREHFFDFFRPQPSERLRVLDGVAFDIEAGETVAIMGRNGCGKSTLLKILCGIYQPDSGTVAVRGPLTPILELGVGWNPELDAIDNILLIGMVMGMSLAEAKQSVDEVLAFAGVERFANLKLKHYSSGMASRLAYSVAFQSVREVLVLDEIFAVGDLGFKARCQERYRHLAAEGRTIVLVSHDVRTVNAFCHRAILLEGGAVIEDAPAAVVCDTYARLLGPGDAPSAAQARTA